MILPLKEQYNLINERFCDRLKMTEEILKQCDLDCLVVMAKEYNEDPLLNYITPAEFITARRLTMLVLFRVENELIMYNASRPDQSLNCYYKQAYFEDVHSQWECLNELFEKHKPSKIALNYSSDFAFADGLTKSLYDDFMKYVDPKFSKLVVSSEQFVIRFLETRTDKEMADYQSIARVAQDIIELTYSDDTIKVGKTTARDLEWFMHQKVNDLGLQCWFLPTIDIQRANCGMLSDDVVILEGDLIHCDFGLKYLNLCTDTQRLCYVLKEGQTQLPSEFRLGMIENNHFQDIVCKNMKIGASGNEVFTNSIVQAKAEGIECILYTHPIGFYGHGPGPTIGLYNQQEPIPIKGDLKLYPNTCYALELTTIHEVDGFGKVRFMTEETIKLCENGITYLMSGRDQIYLVNSKKKNA